MVTFNINIFDIARKEYQLFHTKCVITTIMYEQECSILEFTSVLKVKVVYIDIKISNTSSQVKDINNMSPLI